MRPLLTALVAISIPVGAALAADKLLMRAELSSRVVGNTVHYHAPDQDVYEYLAPDGTIHGESTVHGKYAARWRYFRDDGICFEHADPFQSGCVAVKLNDAQIVYYRYDGAIEGPFEFLPGNPRGL